MTILVIGAKGMLGKDLVPILSTEHKVVGMGHEEIDIRDEEAVKGVFQRLQPNLVINAAAYTEVDESEFQPEKAYSVNAEGARHVAEACAMIHARLFHLSTDYVFDGLSPRPYREEDPPNPMNVYGATKLKGEKLIREILNESLIIRTAWLYGHHGRNFVKAILGQAAQKKEIRVVNDQRGSPTFTQDLSRAILHLIPTAAKGIVHVTNSGSCSWFEFAQEILTEKGIGEVVVVPISSEELKRPARRPANSVLDCSLYKSLTGQTMRSWKEGLRDYIHLSKQ
jgi:dTDP-4-dehydrorhamnose reductase